MSAINVFLQDNDPRIVYSSGWAEVPPLPPQDGEEHGGGAHETSIAGSSATLRFRGNALAVYVTIPSITEAFSASLSITISFDGRLYAWSSLAQSRPFFGQRPFMIDSGLDPNAEHTLVITQGDGIPLRLDSLQYLIPAGGQRGEVVQPHAPDGMLTPLSGAIPDSPPSSPTPTPPRPTPSPSQTNNIPSPNPPPQTPNNASTNATFPSQSPPADESNSLTRSSSNAQEQSDPSPTNSNTLSEATPSGSRAVIITDSKGLVITKILPLDRVITTTDSTGGIVLRTEPAGDSSGGGEDDGNGSGKSALGTGTIIAVVLGIVVALAILGLALLLLLRRRRRKKALEGHHGSGSDISPFDLINGATEGVETGLRKTPAGGAQQEDVPAGDVVLDIRRESRRSTGIRSIFARSGRDMPPPAYSTGGGVVVPPSVR